MKIKKVVNSLVEENTFIIEHNGDFLVVDPGNEPEKVMDIIKDGNLVAILLTHGHFDHILGIPALMKKYNTKIYCHEKDEAFLTDSNLNCARFFQGLPNLPKYDVVHTKEGIMKIGEFEVEIINTPGHTKGCVCYKLGKHMFTGDTIFLGTHGRTDLPTGNPTEMRDSIKKLLKLSNEITIYPGHGENTTIRMEKQNYNN